MKPKTDKRPVGRPSKQTEAIINEICIRIAEGESLRKICRDDHMPEQRTVLRWLAADQEFVAKYVRAREDQTEANIDELTEIADEMPPMDANGRTDSGWVQWQRNRIETRKWIAAKLKPKKYGDKVDVNHGGGINLTVSTGIPDEQPND